jgi:hypothetical protein
MITPALNVVLLALLRLGPTLEGLVEVGPYPSAQEARPAATSAKDTPKGLSIAGRVIDGLGRPVSSVRVTVTSDRRGNGQHVEAVLLTSDDGRYTGILARKDWDADIRFEKDGHSNLMMRASPGQKEITLYRKVQWEKISMLPYGDKNALDQGVRELFASEEWNLDPEGKEKLLALLFTHQDQFRPALRRVVEDARVGVSARDWLDLLGDPGDRDLFPNGRRFAPKHEVKETDLVEAIKATARHFNFLNAKPEPNITVDFIAFTKDLDRVMIQCGINRGALTGFTRRFVFQKVDKHWVLRAAEEAGRS